MAFMGAQENVKFGDSFPKEGGFGSALKEGRISKGRERLGTSDVSKTHGPTTWVGQTL